ncbi:type II toxin-antitoxin system VapC family toxin [Methanobrevibacter sp.]|uniref:type II toxin-antitoxin system VapC family toxin n=1 Tax=Methanobrevibacter sp. TaxID=66852 RepID=UPI00388E307D
MIFLDTGFLFVLLNSSEKFHENAIEIYEFYRKLNSIKVINSVVLTEILNKSHKLNLSSSEIFDVLKKDTKIIYLSYKDFLEALNLNMLYGGAINYSDCTILKTMQDLGINNILSFDSDFDKIRGIERIH